MVNCATKQIFGPLTDPGLAKPQGPDPAPSEAAVALQQRGGSRGDGRVQILQPCAPFSSLLGHKGSAFMHGQCWQKAWDVPFQLRQRLSHCSLRCGEIFCACGAGGRRSLLVPEIIKKTSSFCTWARWRTGAIMPFYHSNYSAHCFNDSVVGKQE